MDEPESEPDVAEEEGGAHLDHEANNGDDRIQGPRYGEQREHANNLKWTLSIYVRITLTNERNEKSAYIADFGNVVVLELSINLLLGQAGDDNGNHGDPDRVHNEREQRQRQSDRGQTEAEPQDESRNGEEGERGAHVAHNTRHLGRLWPKFCVENIEPARGKNTLQNGAEEDKPKADDERVGHDPSHVGEHDEHDAHNGHIKRRVKVVKRRNCPCEVCEADLFLVRRKRQNGGATYEEFR